MEPLVSPAREETLWQGAPSAVVLLGHAAGILAVIIAVPLIAWLAAQGSRDLESAANATRLGWLVTGAIVLLQLIALAVAWARLRSVVYTVTNQRVTIESGLLAKAFSEIDLRYVDDSQFYQSLGQRMLGIGNVTLISSDKSTPTYVLRSIADPRSVRELIREHAYRVSQRQIFTRST